MKRFDEVNGRVKETLHKMQTAREGTNASFVAWSGSWILGWNAH